MVSNADRGSVLPNSTEFYDSRARDSKAKWHYDRAGKQRGASLKKGVDNDYQSELLKRGAKDSSGNQKPLDYSRGKGLGFAFRE